MRTLVELSILGLTAVSVVRGSVITEADAAGFCDGWKLFWIDAASAGGTAGDGGFLVTKGPATRLSPIQAVLWPANWRSTARGHGIRAAIDHEGQIHSTTDGLIWRRRESGTPSSLHSVAFGQGRFVAVGNEGAVVTSTDAVRWRVCDAGTDERLRGIAFGNGLFVAVGYAGTILTSCDGRHWTPRRSSTDVRLQGIAYGSGTFVAVGWHGVILTSQTGTKWTRKNAGTSLPLTQILFVEGRSLTNMNVLNARSAGEDPAAALVGMGPPQTVTNTNASWRPPK